MKKSLSLLFALTLAVSLLAACTQGDSSTDATTEPTDQYDTITIAEALELCGEDGNITEERYYIRGTVASIDDPNYGAMTIKDETGSISVYGTYSADGSVMYANMAEKPYKGDEVLLHCILQNYKGTKEVKNARLIEFNHVDIQVDPSAYTEMSIADARTAAEGAKVMVDGVVAQITYANGEIPSGIMLVDETNAIYVYDSDLAARVAIGNKITICAEKTWWILDAETGNAATFGYKGCCQLDSALLLSHEKTDNEFDKSWIPSSTVKEILDAPVSTDITTTIFKVTAFVKKVPGQGFTNYYINDLDGKTGSYTYTQCNGKDFDWLDAFDGKICTVYLTVINAKSTTSGCVYRFLPVAVVDESFDVSTVNPAEHAVKYYGVGQFLPSYTGDPALELLTSVSSDTLSFQDAKLTYTSSDSSIIAINTAGSKTIMNCLKSGTATITVTGTHGSSTFSKDVTITVTISGQSGNYATISDVIRTETGKTVTVKGIVGPSLVNQTGFYLIDETGAIAVLTTADILDTLKIGNEVVLEGVRYQKQKDGSSEFGQSCLKDATLVTNNYGTHAYSDRSFITGKTLADLAAFPANEDHTTEIYVLKATVSVVEAQYYSIIKLTSNGTDLTLYTSNANQYNWLKPMNGQEVTLELALCNWNCKGYKGCVLSVVNADGTKTVNELNFK